MKILVAGSHGMIGYAVTRHLIEGGHEVVRLVRHEPDLNEIGWNPDTGEIEASSLDGFDGVVNLASMRWPIRWTPQARQKISANRSDMNRLLAETLAGCIHKPQVLICASGIGYYPPSGDTVLTENSPAGTSFLTSLNQNGEAATMSASQAGIRVVHLRIPMVMGGERLKQIGFQAADGQQWMSWVGRDELAFIIEFALRTETLSGPVNAVSPQPLRSAEFAAVATKALGLNPGGIMPAFIVRLVFGEMGEEFILASRRVQPAKLLAAGYQFRFPDLADALCHENKGMNVARATQPA